MIETPTLDMECELASRGYDLVAGFDEVGRGALAGPVMVGCAMVWSRDLLARADVADVHGSQTSDAIRAAHPLAVPDGVADSKLLTEHRREAIFDELAAWPAAWSVGESSNTEIDEWGITYALGVAALRALAKVEKALRLGACGRRAGAPARVAAILDGPYDYITKALNTFDAPDVPVSADVTCKVKADRHCATVSTAAVLAKVTRDRLMVSIAQGNPRYAPYEWVRNKGYGSQAHREAIAALGPTPLHRVSWHLGRGRAADAVGAK